MSLKTIRKMSRVGIVGATGAVGEEIIKCLKQRGYKYSSIKLLSSKRSAGKFLHFDNEKNKKIGLFETGKVDKDSVESIVIEECTKDSFEDLDVVFFSAGSPVSKEFVPIAASKGAFVIDNSSAYRRDDIIPLMVPEVNGNLLKNNPFRQLDQAQRESKVGESDWRNLVIANPNCVTILLTVAIYPLHEQRALERVVVSTYQSASGAGEMAMKELRDQALDWAKDPENFVPKTPIFGKQYLWNVFNHNSDILEDGYNGEEEKVIYETKRILGGKNPVGVTATCVRVPVLSAHSESVNLQFSGDSPVDLKWVQDTLSKAPGVKLLDDRANNQFPEPLLAMGGDDVWVGRIRHDTSAPKNTINLFLAGDQLRKGAALNAVQIAELLKN